MKLTKLCKTVFLLTLIIGASGSAFGKEKDSLKLSANKDELSSIEAGGYILVEAQTGLLLAQKNATRSLEPASITKLMTAYVVYTAIKNGEITLETKTEISPKARKMEGSRMFLELGTWVNIDNLLSGLVIQSGNDAAVALAEAVSATESEFVKRMNIEAKKLQMNNSHFENASGMSSPNHYTTAVDISKLSRALISNFPTYYKRYKKKSFTWNKIPQENRNKLLWIDPRVDGLKTGHTDNAGYCLAASAINNQGMRLISVVLGTKSKSARIKASQKILDYGFREFEYKTLYEKFKPIVQQKVIFGSQNVQIAASQTINLPLPKKLPNRLNSKFIKKNTLEAPIKKGQILGEIVISLDGKKITQVNAISMNNVERVGFFSRLWIRTKQFSSNLF